jgi:CRISPR-associated endonuclease/helicase Cas3
MPDFGSSGLIYDKHILLRTWLVLRDRKAINIPDDVENLIEAVYGKSELKVDERYKAILSTTYHSLDTRRKKKNGSAKSVSLTEVENEDFFESFKFHLDENDPEKHEVLRAQTRDDERKSVNAVVLTYQESNMLNFEEKPNTALVKFLIEREVSLSRSSITEFLTSDASHRPEIWRKVPLLRNHRLVILDESQKYQIGNAILRLDEEKGLVYE